MITSVPVDPSDSIATATAGYLPELAAVAVGAITVGAGVLVFRRGWGFFKGLSK